MVRDFKVVVLSLGILTVFAIMADAQQSPSSGDSKRAQIQQIKQDIQSLRQQCEPIRSQIHQLTDQIKALREQLRPIDEKLQADYIQLKALRREHGKGHKQAGGSQEQHSSGVSTNSEQN